MKNTNCAYCMQGELVAKFGYLACELESSFVYVFKEQSKYGRFIVAHKKHVSEMTDLTDEERNVFFSDVNKVAKAMHKAFNPDKINYGAYGDTGGHLHFHLVPKYKDQDEWGGTFTMNSGKLMFDDEKCQEVADKLIACLEK